MLRPEFVRPCLEDYRSYVESVAAFIDRIEASSR
jgi:hypothetical protein